VRIHESEPSRFTAGTTVQWTRVVSGYAHADGWTVRYYFRGASNFQVDAVEDGTRHLVTLGAAATTQKLPGRYRWWLYAERGSGDALERIPLAKGQVIVAAAVADAADGAFRSFNERMYAAIRAVLEGRITADVEAMTLRGTALTRIPIERLQRMEGVYAWRVWRERNKGKLGITVRSSFVGG